MSLNSEINISHNYILGYSTPLPVKVHIRDHLRTFPGSAGQCTHKPVDVHIDPFCTLTVTYTYLVLIIYLASGKQKIKNVSRQAVINK
jgi:hypothetical protein